MKKVCVAEEGLSSKGCPTLLYKDVLAEADKEYNQSEIFEFARQASLQEADCYANRHQRPYVMQPTKTRIVEIYEFAEKMKYQRLGLAFCLGLAKEAAIVEEILKDRGFKVVSVGCKARKDIKTAHRNRGRGPNFSRLRRGHVQSAFPGQITESRANGV